MDAQDVKVAWKYITEQKAMLSQAHAEYTGHRADVEEADPLRLGALLEGQHWILHFLGEALEALYELQHPGKKPPPRPSSSA